MTKESALEVLAPDPAVSPAKALEASQTFTPQKSAKAVQVSEPVTRALRRILGDSVLDIFPSGLVEAVDNAYEFWMKTPDSYLITNFDTEQDKLDSLIIMRAYADCADDGGYTIRTLADDDPRRLVWRAQTRRKARGSE